MNAASVGNSSVVQKVNSSDVVSRVSRAACSCWHAVRSLRHMAAGRLLCVIVLSATVYCVNDMLK